MENIFSCSILKLKRIGIITLLYCCANLIGYGQHLDYKLDYDGANNKIHVMMKFSPLTEKTVEFIYANPMFGGQNDIVDCIKEVNVSGAESWSFAIDSRKLSITPSKARNYITIKYSILGKPGQKDEFHAELFRPIITDNSLYCHGLNLFLTPVSANMTQSMSWTTDPPFEAIAVWNPEATVNDTIDNPVMESYMSLLVGGQDIKLERTDFQNMHGYVITSIDDNKAFNRDLVAQFFKDSMSGLREFWKESDVEDHYVFAMLPFSNNITHEVGGIGLSGGFCSKYRDHEKRDTVLTPAIKFNVTHEMGHKWLGGSFSLGMEHQWFHEGFNDYLTYRVLSKKELLTDEQLESKWNSLLESYYGSEIHTMPNDKILENYWTMGDYNKMPYWRGCIFAHYLNQLIKKGTNGKQNWESFMVNLYSILNQKSKIAIEDFTSTLQPLLPEGYEANNLVERHMIRGKEIDRELVSWK